MSVNESLYAKPVLMKWGIIGVVVFIAAYLASLLLYVTSGMSHPHQVTESESDTDGTTVTVDLEDIRSNNSVLVGNVTITPGPALLDPATHKLKEDLDVDVSSVVTPSKRAWSKGTLPDVFPVSLILSGDVGDWPFDHYRTKPIAIELDRGPAAVPQRATVTFVDRLLGWQVGATEVGKGEMPRHIDWISPGRRAPWRSVWSSSVCTFPLPAWACSLRSRRCGTDESSSRR
nr:hypothetical protein MFLOJ_24610 [Mycobacterium florentinum]